MSWCKHQPYDMGVRIWILAVSVRSSITNVKSTGAPLHKLRQKCCLDSRGRSPTVAGSPVSTLRLLRLPGSGDASIQLRARVLTPGRTGVGHQQRRRQPKEVGIG